MQTPPSDDDRAELPAELSQLQSGSRLDLAAMLAVWQGRNPDDWSRSPVAYQLLAHQLLGAGEPLLAYDVSDEGLQRFPLDLRLRQYQGLALARSGATERARDMLHNLYLEGHRDEETLGLLARTYKDLYFASEPSNTSQGQLRRAADLYSEAYTRHSGYWSGINAATLATLLGDRAQAATLAQAVRHECQLLLEQLAEGADAYWLLATLGEASVILEEWTQAGQWYSRAAESGRLRLGDIVSTRHNARLLLAHAAGDHPSVQEALRVPSVAVFSGHMVDHPDRAVARFPDYLGPEVGQAIRDRLRQHDCQIGYASAAAGADVLFLEALLELGGETNVVLPYAQEEFLRDSAQFVGNASWIERTERVLRRATRVIVASQQQRVAGPTTFEFANLMLEGLAANRAEHLETHLIRLAVWDGKPGDGAGGTATAVGRWQRAGLVVDIVTPPAVTVAIPHPAPSTSPAPTVPSSEPATSTPHEGFASQIVALLFGDAVHFSRLAEDELVRFGEHFLGAIGQLVTTNRHAPVLKNTWGDGLFFVFSGVRDAGMFALALRDLVNGTDWATKGLPAGLNLRIGLHAGAVFSFVDPITGRPNYLGTQVSRAARIEPITPPGQVYASEAFAALVAADHVAEFTCDYVGQTPHAKGYGTFPMYHVRPK